MVLHPPFFASALVFANILMFLWLSYNVSHYNIGGSLCPPPAKDQSFRFPSRYFLLLSRSLSEVFRQDFHPLNTAPAPGTRKPMGLLQPYFNNKEDVLGYSQNSISQAAWEWNRRRWRRTYSFAQPHAQRTALFQPFSFSARSRSLIPGRKIRSIFQFCTTSSWFSQYPAARPAR